jgi:hypothetical protein
MTEVETRAPSQQSAWQPQQYWRMCSLSSSGFAILDSMGVVEVRDRGRSCPTYV